MITTPNIRSGVPCTLRHINRVSQGKCPEVKIRKQFEQEFDEDVQNITSEAINLASQVKILFEQNKPLKVYDRKEIVSKLEMLVQDLQKNLPFVQTSFNKSMDKTVKEAKAEVEASISQKIQSIGLDGLRTQIAGTQTGVTETAVRQLQGNIDEEENH